MARVTIKELQKQIENLKSLNEFHISENIRLNKEIADLRSKGNMVPKKELDILVEQIEYEKQMTTEYKRLYEDLRNKYDKLRESSSVIKNARGAGRKAFSDIEVIQSIYRLYLQGNSLKTIADELNSTGSRTKRGGTWSKSSVRFILLNEKNVLSGFIDEDTFSRAVKLLNDNRKTKNT